MKKLLGSDSTAKIQVSLHYSCICYFRVYKPHQQVSKSRSRLGTRQFSLLACRYTFKEKRFGGREMGNKKHKCYLLPQQHAKSNRIGDNEQTPGNVTGHLIKSCSLQRKQQKLRLTILSGATSNTTHGPDFHTTGICVAVKKLAPKLCWAQISAPQSAILSLIPKQNQCLKLSGIFMWLGIVLKNYRAGQISRQEISVMPHKNTPLQLWKFSSVACTTETEGIISEQRVSFFSF